MTSSVYVGDSVTDFFGSGIASRRPSYIVTSMATADTISAAGALRERKYGPRSDALQVIPDVDLSGKTMFITGTTAGIGVETARALAIRGAHIVMANRNLVLSEEVKKSILEDKPEAKIDLIPCDLSSLQSVQAAAKDFKDKHWPLHALILNAGVFTPDQKSTIDGLESHHGVNHVAHQYLIRELLPVLRQTEGSRIVIVSSDSHGHTGLKESMSTDEKLQKICPEVTTSEFGYRLYAHSKMCNVLTAMKLHRDEYKNGIAVYVLHPGTMIATSISRSWPLAKFFNTLVKPFTKSVSQGAATTVYCAGSPEVAQISGKYWASCWDDEKTLHKEIAHDEALQDALWQRTDDLLDQFEAKRQPITAVAE